MTYKPRNLRIISIRTAKRILHIEDVLELDRIRFELWDYARGEGSRAHVDAYLERHTARALAAELATGRLAECDGLEDLGGGIVDGAVTARVFRIENADTHNPIRIAIGNGPGVKQSGGLISPQKGARQTRLQILLSRLDAKRAGLAILDHIRAWEVNTYTTRVEAGTWRPTSQEGEPPAGPAPPGGEGVAREAAPLRYGDGSPLSGNPAEEEAFHAYHGAKKRIPRDIDALREWVRDPSGG